MYEALLIIFWNWTIAVIFCFYLHCEIIGKGYKYTYVSMHVQNVIFENTIQKQLKSNFHFFHIGKYLYIFGIQILKMHKVICKYVFGKQK